MNNQLKIIISAEISKVKQGVQNAQKQLNGFQGTAQKISQKTKAIFDKIGDSIKKGLGNAVKFAGDAMKTAAKGMKTAAKGIATSFTAITGAILGVVKGTEEYRNSMAKLTTAFEAAGGSAEEAKKTYNDLYRVLGDSGQATEAANHLAKLTTEEEALAEWTTICQGVYATFGESLPIEGLTEAANETAKVGAVTGSLADALNWAGISEDDFNKKLEKCNSEAERERLIRETLNGLYNDAAAKYEENNSAVLKQNEAQAKLQENLAKVGEALAPIVTLFTDLASQALELVLPYIQELADTYVPLLQEHFGSLRDVLIEVKDKFVEIYNTIVEGFITAIQEATTWMKEHETQLVLIAIAVGTLTTAIVAYNIAQAISNAGGIAAIASNAALAIGYYALAAAQAVATAASTAFGAVMAFITSPITLVILGIGALIAIIYVCVKHWDVIKEAAVAAWEWIKKTWEKVGNWFNNNVVTPVKNFFGNLWTGIKNIFGNIKGWFTEKFQSAVSGIKNAFSSVTGFFSGIWDKIKSIFSNVGSAIANGIKGAVSSAVNQVLSRAVTIINGFISAINFAIGIINKIPGVEISKLSKLDVPKMAKGGIVDSATLAVIGEQGKEAVVPLENNTEWMDKLATMLTERMGGGGAPIVLTVDGKVFAQTAISTINQQTRQTGRLALNLV